MKLILTYVKEQQSRRSEVDFQMGFVLYTNLICQKSLSTICCPICFATLKSLIKQWADLALSERNGFLGEPMSTTSITSIFQRSDMALNSIIDRYHEKFPKAFMKLFR